MEIVICKQCKDKKEESEVVIKTVHTKPTPAIVYYDTKGVKHVHNPDLVVASYICSKGHIWCIMNYSLCPNPDCEWSSKDLVRDET